ncbi:MAG TPA: outer membrane lipoprotein carrier protein LolA [Bacteroidota bacterium]|nr:outer membrane lipoprotein carrier protein LolA [Bacteroidota bacterium]
MMRLEFASKLHGIILPFAVVLLFTPFFHTAYGQPAEKLTAPEVLAKVQKTYANATDASADFSETVSLRYAGIKQSYSGTVTMKKGNKYRIESQEQTIVTDGKTVWAYSPVNKQVVVDNYKESTTAFSPEQFLLGLPANYRATLVDNEAGEPHASYVLKLTPRTGASKFVKSVKVWVDDSDWSVRGLEYVDMNETHTTYVLTSVRFNTGVPDGQFTFVVPEHVEVVDLRLSERQAPSK